MRQDEGCSGCSGAGGSCHSIYGRLGHAQGPSVATEVLVAFGIPIVVFIVALTIAGTWLGGTVGGHAAGTLLSLVVALAVTGLAVLVVWKASRKVVRRHEAKGQDPLEVQK